MKKIFIASVGLIFVPILAFASIDTNLYYGLHDNTEVKELQEFLIDKGFLTGSATGNFYSLTLKAVKQYQASVSLPKSGYVGTLTRKSINDELAANLGDSNQEATAETGSTPPVTEPQKTTNDVVSQLQAQNTLLQNQLNSLNTQVQQVQQNTQQIIQNTAPTPQPSPEDITYDHFDYTISPSMVTMGSQATITVKAISQSGKPLSNRELYVWDRNYACDAFSFSENQPALILHSQTDSNGQVQFQMTISKDRYNFLTIHFSQEIQGCIAIPTSSPQGTWIWHNKNGEDFTYNLLEQNSQ